MRTAEDDGTCVMDVHSNMALTVLRPFSLSMTSQGQASIAVHPGLRAWVDLSSQAHAAHLHARLQGTPLLQLPRLVAVRI